MGDQLDVERAREQTERAQLVGGQAGRQQLVLAGRTALDDREEPRDGARLPRRGSGDASGVPQERHTVWCPGAVEAAFGDVACVRNFHDCAIVPEWVTGGQGACTTGTGVARTLC